MPIIENSSYRPPILLANGHLQTIVPSLFRKITQMAYLRERIATPDDDFLDIDWSLVHAGRLGILSHGLEGSTERAYIKGMARMLNSNGWDSLAWNFRGCSGEPNRCLHSYHSGKSDDLHVVIEHALQTGRYETLCLIGYSMGGNITLKYLGERGDKVPEAVKAGVAFSVPCDLKSSADKLARFSNKIYMARFLKMLHQKVVQKMERFPGQVDDTNYASIRDFRGFDDRYTAPHNGFRDAEDYWRQCSSLYYLENIARPTLLINSLDDPFLSAACYPREIAEKNDNFFLEMPARGGHVGFMQLNYDGAYWSEVRAMEFIAEEAI